MNRLLFTRTSFRKPGTGRNAWNPRKDRAVGVSEGMPMTVNELIQLLNGYRPDLRVVVNGYEDGYDGPCA